MKNQSGNVLFLILIAVVLFAALSYAVTSSQRGGGTSISKDKAKANAAALLQYGTTLRNAVMRVKISNGCTDYTLDFSNPVFMQLNGALLMIANSDAPSNKTCHIFDTMGGNANPTIANQDSIDRNLNIYATWPKYGHYLINLLQLRGVGTDGPAGTASANDIVLWLDRVDKETCIAINDLVGVSNPSGNPPIATWGGGSTLPYGPSNFTATATISHSTTNGSPVFCRDTSGSGGYNFLFTLVER